MSFNFTLGVGPTAINVLSARFLFQWRGVWQADLILDLLTGAATLPTGAQTLAFQDSTLPCTVDTRFSSTFGGGAAVRVVGGAGKWDTQVGAKYFSVPSGALTSTIVYADTATAIGELPPVDPSPVKLGTAYTRQTMTASQVFAGRDWYLDLLSGQVQVQAWLAASLDDGATITQWDPLTQTATITSETLVLPGTVISDSRLGSSSYMVRDVEHVFDSHNGAVATCYCAANPTSRLVDAMQAAIQRFANIAYLQVYAYRYVLGDPGQMALQAITPNAPDLNPIAQWTGLAGTVAKLAPSTIVVIGFIAGDPTQPYVVAVGPGSQSDPGEPTEVDIGSLLTAVNLSGGTFALTIAPWAISLAAALATFSAALGAAFGTLNSASSAPPLNALQPGFIAGQAAMTAFTAALAALPPPATTRVKGT